MRMRIPSSQARLLVILLADLSNVWIKNSQNCSFPQVGTTKVCTGVHPLRTMSYEKVAGKMVGPRLREILVPHGSYVNYVANSCPFGKRRRSATARKPETERGSLYPVSRT